MKPTLPSKITPFIGRLLGSEEHTTAPINYLFSPGFLVNFGLLISLLALAPASTHEHAPPYTPTQTAKDELK